MQCLLQDSSKAKNCWKAVSPWTFLLLLMSNYPHPPGCPSLLSQPALVPRQEADPVEAAEPAWHHCSSSRGDGAVSSWKHCLGNDLQSEWHDGTEQCFPSPIHFFQTCGFISPLVLTGGGTVLMCLHAKYPERIPTVRKMS